VLGTPVPFHRHCDEVNLRFYVRRRAPEAWRRAVVFIREVVPRPLIALAARLWYNEPYVALPMLHTLKMEEAERGGPGLVRYQWLRRGRWHTLEAEAEGKPRVPAPGSEEEFITEHYWGYTVQRDGGTLEYEVAHPRWRVWRARRARFDCDVVAMYGAHFEPALCGPPASAFVAEGSPVAVFRGRRLPAPREALVLAP
jgi:uncharacterized protein YqjF (DUF2071 family)